MRIKTGEGASVMRGGGSVLKAPQRRRGGTPPQALSDVLLLEGY